MLCVPVLRELISELTKDIVFTDDCENTHGFDCFPFTDATIDDNVDLDDAPLYWSDSHFLKELGFTGAFVDDREEEDMTLTNVMQHLGTFLLLVALLI